MKIGERVLFLCAMSAANNFADNFGLGTDVGFDARRSWWPLRSTPSRLDISSRHDLPLQATRSRLCKRR